MEECGRWGNPAKQKVKYMNANRTTLFCSLFFFFRLTWRSQGRGIEAFLTASRVSSISRDMMMEPLRAPARSARAPRTKPIKALYRETSNCGEDSHKWKIQLLHHQPSPGGQCWGFLGRKRGNSPPSRTEEVQAPNSEASQPLQVFWIFATEIFQSLAIWYMEASTWT